MQLDANGDEYGTLDPVSVTLDNATTSAYSLVNIVAADRKGLFYDLMRTLKDIHLRVAYAKVPCTPCKYLADSLQILRRYLAHLAALTHSGRYCAADITTNSCSPCRDAGRFCKLPRLDGRARAEPALCGCLQVDVRNDGMCEADLFVQEVDGGRIRNTCAPVMSVVSAVKSCDRTETMLAAAGLGRPVDRPLGPVNKTRQETVGCLAPTVAQSLAGVTASAAVPS